MAAARKQSGRWSFPLMLLSFVLIGGFLFYLNQASKATVVEVVQANEDEEETAAPARELTWAEFMAAPESFQGERVRLADLEVVSRVGAAAFWVETPAGSYYLVRMVPDLIARGVDVAPGQRATVTGTVHMMGDSVLNAWLAEGYISEGQRAEAEFAISFLEVDRLTVR